MNGILVDENNDLQVSIKRDSEGLITQGFPIDNIDYQRCNFIIVAQKGEFKEAPTLGLGIDNYLKRTITAHGKQQFITELKSELSSDGIRASVKVNGNDVSNFDIHL